MTTRRELGETLYDQAQEMLRAVTAWQEANPRVIDYRVADAQMGLVRAVEGLRLLAVNGHSAAFNAEVAELSRRLNFKFAAVDE